MVDLFAGIGGIRLGVERAAQELGQHVTTVAASEIDPTACHVYHDNTGHTPLGDITLDETKAAIPVHDILVGGFPCQAFSRQGHRKGFEDTRGTLFFEVASILETHQPETFLLENVKDLTTHDGGHTFKTILHTLQYLGYNVAYRVMEATAWLPQRRPRVIITGQRYGQPVIPEPAEPACPHILSEILHDYRELERHIPDKYQFSDKMEAYFVKRRALGHNAHGDALASHTKPAGTLLASNINRPHIKTEGHKNGRRLSPREWARLQGFPDSYQLHATETHAYRHIGNSVPVPMITHAARPLIMHLANIQHPGAT